MVTRGFLLRVFFYLIFVDMKKLINFLLSVGMALLDRLALMRINPNAFYPNQKAVVKFSALMTEIKGKIGGTVFQGGKCGPIVKNKPDKNTIKLLQFIFNSQYGGRRWDIDMAGLNDSEAQVINPDGSLIPPPNTRSPNQIVRKLSKLWSTLSASDREAWNAYAPNYPFKNKFGDTYTGSGYQVFMAINLKLKPVFGGYTPLPPPVGGDELITHTYDTMGFFADENGSNLLQFSIPDGIPDGAVLIIRSGPAQSNGKLKPVFGGRNNPNTHTCGGKMIAAFKDPHPGKIELLPIWQNYFGIVPPNSTIWFDIEVMNLYNGQTLFAQAYPAPVSTLEQIAQLVIAAVGRQVPDGEFTGVNALSWLGTDTEFDFGNVTVGEEADSYVGQLRGLQLPSGTDVTLTSGGDGPTEIGMFVNGYDDALDGAINITVNKYDTFGPCALLVRAHPTSVGLKTTTLTLTHPNLTDPVVITFKVTGV